MFVVAVDIGTSTTRAIIGQRDEDRKIKVVAHGLASSTGIERGVIVDMEATIESIKKAVHHAQFMSDLTVESCYVGVSGNNITSVRGNGMVTLPRGKVFQEDIQRVIDSAKIASKVPDNMRVLHEIPHGFTLDTDNPARNPEGMHARSLNCSLQLICCSETILRNIESCFERCHIAIDAIVLNQIAESHVVLEEEEKNHGVCLVKIGAGTTDLGIYFDGTLQFYQCLQVGGDLVTSDIASALHTSPKYAEEIKVKYACALSEAARQNNVTIRIPGIGKHVNNREMERATLADFVEPRYEEIFGMVHECIEKSGLSRKITSGIVLTGGGVNIEGAEDLATQVFRKPIRISYATEFEDYNLCEPEYSTLAGLLLYGIDNNINHSGKNTKNKSFLSNAFGRLFS